MKQLYFADTTTSLSLSLSLFLSKDEQPDRGVVGKANVEEHGDMQSGEFMGLEVGKTYWVVVEEDNEEAKKSEERQQAFLARKQKDKEEDEASAKKNPGITASCISSLRTHASEAEGLRQGWGGGQRQSH